MISSGRLHHWMVSPGCSGWPAFLLAAAFAQASRFLLARKPIRGGWQMAVVTVFGQPTRQLLDLFFELFYLLFQRQQFCNATLLCFLQPSVQHFHLPIDDHRTKILRELIGSCQDFVLDA